MRALILILTLSFAGLAWGADRAKEKATNTEPRAADGSKPLALPDTTLVDRVEDPKKKRFTEVCTSAEGRQYKKDEKGYDDCVAKVKGSAFRVDPRDPNPSRQDPGQKKDSVGTSYQLGK